MVFLRLFMCCFTPASIFFARECYPIIPWYPMSSGQGRIPPAIPHHPRWNSRDRWTAWSPGTSTWEIHGTKIHWKTLGKNKTWPPFLPKRWFFMGKLFIDFQEDLHIHMTNHPFSDISSAEKMCAWQSWDIRIGFVRQEWGNVWRRRMIGSWGLSAEIWLTNKMGQ